jgi:hypothetical protein
MPVREVKKFAFIVVSPGFQRMYQPGQNPNVISLIGLVAYLAKYFAINGIIDS